jgi:hypothetical protein
MAETEGGHVPSLATPETAELRDATERQALVEPTPVRSDRQAEAEQRADQATDADVAENYDDAAESVADHQGVDRTLER